MTFMDLISLIGLLLSVASFIASSLSKFKSYRREFMAIGYVLFGFVISRVVYIYLPPGNIGGAVEPRSIVLMIIIMVMSIVVLVALKKEGSQQATWLCSFFLSI